MQRHALPIAAVVLLLLLGWLWFLERRPTAPEVAPNPLATPLWTDFDADAVREVSIRDKGDRAILLQRSEGPWLARLPDDDRPRRGNQDLADAAANALAALESDRTLPDATEASDYGLGTEALEVVLRLASGEARTLRIGDALTVAHGRYARVDGSSMVHVISSAPLLALTRDPMDYRDRRVLPLEPDQILGIHSELSDPALTLERRDATWVLGLEPVGRADTNAVSVLLDMLTTMPGRAWDPADAAPAGPSLVLDTAAGEVVLQLMQPLGPTPPLTLKVRVSGPLPEPRDDDLVVTIPTETVSGLRAAPEHWRSAELVDLNPWLVTGFQWSARGSAWTFEEGESGWVGPEAQGARTPIERERVHRFLQTVDGLVGLGWIPQDEAPSGLVETARISGHHKDGSGFGLTLLRGPSRDYARADGEGGLREIDSAANDLLGFLHALPEAP